MADTFAQFSDSPSNPARQMFAITPGASVIDPLPKAIRADTAGSVTLQAVDSATPVTITMAAGEIIAVRAKYVTAATATVHGLA